MKTSQDRIRELELCLAQLLGFVEALRLPDGVQTPVHGVYDVLYSAEVVDTNYPVKIEPKP